MDRWRQIKRWLEEGERLFRCMSAFTEVKLEFVPTETYLDVLKGKATPGFNFLLHLFYYSAIISSMVCVFGVLVSCNKMMLTGWINSPRRCVFLLSQKYVLTPRTISPILLMTLTSIWGVPPALGYKKGSFLFFSLKSLTFWTIWCSTPHLLQSQNLTCHVQAAH